VFSDPRAPVPTWRDTIVVDLVGARGRRVEQQYNGGATCSFTLDGRSAAAAQVLELRTDVIAWRWDEHVGADVPVGRFVVDHAEDQITEQSHTVTFTGHDYFAMLLRRILVGPQNYTNTDQDNIATSLVTIGSVLAQSSGAPITSFAPAGFLPIMVARCNPDGTARAALSGQLRTRQYTPQSVIGELVDQLANVQGGFDYDVVPALRAGGLGLQAGVDALRVFYPYQGEARTDMLLAYGSNVSTLTRTVAAADYGNYYRLLGDNGGAANQLFAETWTDEALHPDPTRLGLWQLWENASDVNQQATLNEQVAGLLAQSSILQPSYTVGMRPGAYVWGSPRMGDTVRLLIQTGRLDVDTSVRVVGIAYSIGDDGDENVELTVGRPRMKLPKVIARGAKTADAIARR
jgi:hypothetical protein